MVLRKYPGLFTFSAITEKMEVEVITFTVAAIDRVLTLMEQENDHPLALRIAIVGRGPGGFQYNLQFMKESECRPDDVVVDIGAFKVVVDRESAADLKDAVVDWVDEGFRGGFRIDNPNPVWKDPVARQVQEVIDRSINPAIASHGGTVTLLDVKDGVAYIRFGGGCQGCGMVDVTLKQGVETMIRRAVPQIRQVVDTTDHAAGTNPYYQSSRDDGRSPLSE